MFKKIAFWAALVFMLAYFGLVIYRAFVLYGEDRTQEHVAKIHATKLSLDDVMGKNLPSLPSNPDATAAGVDANKNGIRDDVELAIFKAYPNSAKTRAVLLQYALALQMEVTQEKVNTGTVIAVAQLRGKASSCIGESHPRDDLQKFIEVTQRYVDFIDKSQLNTSERIEAQNKFYRGKLDSFSSLDETCDIDLKMLPN